MKRPVTGPATDFSLRNKNAGFPNMPLKGKQGQAPPTGSQPPMGGMPTKLGTMPPNFKPKMPPPMGQPPMGQPPMGQNQIGQATMRQQPMRFPMGQAGQIATGPQQYMIPQAKGINQPMMNQPMMNQPMMNQPMMNQSMMNQTIGYPNIFEQQKKKM